MVLYLWAIAAIALCLSVLMAGAWMVLQRTGNSGSVDPIRTFSIGLVGAASALWPVAGAPAASPGPKDKKAYREVKAAFMYWILVHVTGIPPLEQQMLRLRHERDRDYQSRTSMFFPLPPQKGAAT